MSTANNPGIAIPRILIPDDKVNMKKWAVIACDQYTSDQRYWAEAERLVGNAPSTLHMMLPEAYLDASDKQERIADARDAMYDYIEAGILKELPEGFILVERMIGGLPRKGLMVLIDLEDYEFDITAKPLVRPTEQTVRDRIPPRMQIRMDAAVEMPHILALIDDPGYTVIEPVYEKRTQLKKLYDFDLMLGGGAIAGYFVDSPEITADIMQAMAALPTHDGMKICVGDGNHSLATAKEIWNRAKLSLSAEELAVSPLRYAMVELINLHDPALSMLPIHRALFGVNPATCIQYIVEKLNARGLGARLIFSRRRVTAETMDPNTIYFNSKDSMGRIELSRVSGNLMLEDLQIVLEQFAAENPSARLDYIHGDETIAEIKNQYDTLCFVLPALSKKTFMDTIVRCGVLPKKCFSLGEADEKRFYLECRLLVLPDEDAPAEEPIKETAAPAEDLMIEEHEEAIIEEEEYEDFEEETDELSDEAEFSLRPELIDLPEEPVSVRRQEGWDLPAETRMPAEETPLPQTDLRIEQFPADLKSNDVLLEEFIDNLFED